MITPSHSCDPASLQANALYGVAVAPFLATPLDVISLSSNGSPNDTITLNVTTDTELAPRPVTLPLWFAKQFCSFSSVATDGEPADDSGDGGGENISATMWSPTCAVDQRARVVITPAPRPPVGMSKVGEVHDPALRLEAPQPVLGTDEERRAFAGASAHLVLSAHHAVPHNVVPALVFEHVVAPFVANACCSLKQSRVGVTSWVQVEDSPFTALRRVFPNLKRLELESGDFKGPLQDSVESLVLGRCQLQCLPSVPNLRSLTIECSIDLGKLAALAAQPVLTVENLVIRGIASLDSSADMNRRRLTLLSECFPRIRALRCLRAVKQWDDWVAEYFEQSAFWPELNTLDIAGSYIVDIVAARPTAWTHLTLRCADTPVSNRVTTLTDLTNVEYLFVGCRGAAQSLMLENAVALRVLHLPCTLVHCDGQAIGPNLTHISFSDPVGDLSDTNALSSSDGVSWTGLDRHLTLRRVTSQREAVCWQRGGPEEVWSRSPPVRPAGVMYERHEQGLTPSHADRDEMYAQRLYRDFLRDSGQLQQRFTPRHEDVIPFRLAPSAACESASDERDTVSPGRALRREDLDPVAVFERQLLSELGEDSEKEE